MAKYAYLTCELKSRDFDSRLLIAAHLLKRGVTVVVGQLWGMLAGAHQAPKGVFLFKTANTIQIGLAEHVKAWGHKAVLMDEEALALVSPYLMRRIVPPKALLVADAFLFQNQMHRDVLGGQGPLVGSPRVDLLRHYRGLHANDVAACRRAGAYVLINTNYGIHNSAYGAPEAQFNVARDVGMFEEATEEGRAYARSWFETERLNMQAMHDLVTRLQGQLGDRRLVIRPHPTENAHAWKQYTGAEVISESAPVPWLLGADIVVHTNSTTGLEAALLGRPTLNLNPAPTSVFSQTFASNQAACQAQTAEDAATRIKQVLRGETPPRNDDWIPEFPENAADRIAAELAPFMPEAGALTSWPHLQRTDTQLKKFTVSVDEAIGRVNLFFAGAGAPRTKMTVLDDSLFMLSPDNG